MKAEGREFTYREYTEQPLTETEIKTLLSKLSLRAGDVLRKRDAANRELKLSGGEPEAVLIRHMARYPTLLQRPIGVLGSEAVVGRPVENLLSLLKG